MTLTNEPGGHCATLARNLINTLGVTQAKHAARQFGWYGVVQEISRQSESDDSQAPLEGRSGGYRTMRR
ncbi:hypothetical protein [Oceanibacterium hippocampi]|uniref:hypothetical protein n=1 Tax=Oceanibacterium hippocampi TaxID=745714 RepID=UPI00111C3F80|nr:hypothetical protein [Oceanibacterium hippocampi]